MSKFVVCEVCGNIAEKVYETGVPMMCCGKKMLEMVANTTEAATEKHLPLIDIKEKEVLVNVGEIEHPMGKEHLINWVTIQTTKGWKFHRFNDTDKPTVSFKLDNESVISAYAYCNLHGLWKTSA